jgi:hypothetical protein
MSNVVFMLSNDTTLPSPKQPAFIQKKSYNSGDPSTSEGSHSINEVTITSGGATVGMGQKGAIAPSIFFSIFFLILIY